MKANLIYHLCASDNEFFWLNLYKLSFYHKVFDGRIIISLYQYPDEAKKIPLEIVTQYIREKISDKAEIWEMDSTPSGESGAFFDVLLPKISDDKENITFFGHTKGFATYFTPDGIGNAPYVKKWVDCLYDVNLSNMENVKSVFARPDKNIAGIFLRQAIPTWNMPWHFSGAFFWFKNSAVFSKEWNIRPRHDRFDLECWPGFMFPMEQAECLGILETDYEGGWLNPYSKECWDKIERNKIKLFK